MDGVRWLLYSWRCKGPSSVLGRARAGSVLCTERSWGRDLAVGVGKRTMLGKPRTFGEIMF